ncbi:MAG: secretin N-terminal domain-containing protein, partial [Methyloligellaceae bacterium]
MLLLAFASASLTACRSTSKDGRHKEKNVFEQLTDADLSPPPRSRGAGTRNGSLEPEASDDSYESYPGDSRASGGRGTARTAGRSRRGVSQVAEGYELNFSNASLPELTKVILKDTLKIPYVYDARVQGNVTLSTGRAVSREELLTALESVLQMNRGALVRQGDGYRVVAESSLKKGGAGAVDYASEARRVGPGYGLTIFPLQHVSAETMLRMLSAFVAKTGALRADVRKNLLLVRGTGPERRNLMQVATQL